MCWSKGREKRPLTQCRSHRLCRCPWKGPRHLLHSRTPWDQKGGHSTLEHSVCRSWLVLSSHLLYTCIMTGSELSLAIHVYHDWFWALTCYTCVSWLVLSSHLLYMCIMTGSELSLPIHVYHDWFWALTSYTYIYQTDFLLYGKLHKFCTLLCTA